MNIEQQSDGRYFVYDDNGKVVRRTKSYEWAMEKLNSLQTVGKRVVTNNPVTIGEKIIPIQEKPTFPINQRFEFLESAVSMIANNQHTSLIVTGEGGLGKTHTVVKTLEKFGLTPRSIEEIDEPGKDTFVNVKGFSTPKSLYRTLYQNREKIIVFDDCDSIQKCPTSLNILKGALDSYSERWITWNSETKDDLPRAFEFKGQIIFISNLKTHKIDGAIRSRGMMIDLEMTLEQKVERMHYLISNPEFMSEYEMAHKSDALKVIQDNISLCSGLSLRTLISVTKIASSGVKDWEEMAKYIICTEQ